ncbi:reticulon-4 receptor-like 2 [Toxorhynchites rutilus septentrionalis]|uniref:reticulon-4 receptor-like 2 n=1 Tax=Toxorhynchites rutilus septentrionalis TaxID=329112 RepID=UPI00247B1F40|nr:reticulon-4 receptor-like 2 [Toxorhynchites rutilus septentrionalis]
MIAELIHLSTVDRQSTMVRRAVMGVHSEFLLRWAVLITFAHLSITADYSCTDRYKEYCVVENVTADAIDSSSFPPEKALLIQNSTIPVFGEHILRKMAPVESLMIHHLKIEQLQLAECDQLLTLFASYNHISELTVANDFPLRNLHLYQNLLTNISGLRVLTSLEQLYLNDNLLANLEFDVFANMKHLKILTLHRNFLTAIDCKQSISLPALESLFLQHNKLTYLDTGMWKMPSLQKLDLSANELAFLFTFLEEFPALRVLELYDNKWNCAWLSKMVDRMELREIQHTQVDPTCDDGVLFDEVCCLHEADAPDPMMLLISRTTVVDDLQGQLGAQRKTVGDLEEAHRKQTFKFEEMQDKIDRLDEFCRGEF